ncbi:hypothetical protein ACWIGI_18530 [Nocardia sp. NPDC055321]
MEAGHERDAIQFANAWAAHVEKIDRDRELPWSDRTVWNEYDFCAALLIRDRLQDAIRVLPADVGSRMIAFAAEADDRYLSITVEDSGKRMAAVSNLDVTDRGWWWFRVPDSGPITQDLARWRQAESS